jgi:hypothetical protein
MSDERAPEWDDLLLVEEQAEPDTHWYLYLWSRHCAEQGLPDGSSEEQPLLYEKAPRFVEWLRSAHNRFSEGNILALLDAVHICRDEAIPFPNWVVSGLEQFMVETVVKGAPGRRGRSNNPLARARQTFKQQKQRAVIDGIRRAQKWGFDPETGEPSDLFLFMTLPNEVKSYVERHGMPALGSNLQAAVELAEKSLRGTEFQAAFSTLERLAKSTRDDTFTVEEPSVRAALGIASLDELPAAFGEFGFSPADGPVNETAPPGIGDTTEVKKKDVFWIAIRRREIGPSS